MITNDELKNETYNGTEPVLGEVWNDCPIEGCTNKVCLALNSDKCFPHTKGYRQSKLLKIWWKSLFRLITPNSSLRAYFTDLYD